MKDYTVGAGCDGLLFFKVRIDGEVIEHIETASIKDEVEVEDYYSHNSWNSLEIIPERNEILASGKMRIIGFEFKDSFFSQKEVRFDSSSPSSGFRNVLSFANRRIINDIENISMDRIVTCGGDPVIKMIDIENGKVLKTFSSHSDTCYRVPKASSTSFCSCSNDKDLKHWDVEKGLIKSWKGHDGYGFGCDFSIDQNLLFSGGSECCCKMWDFRSGYKKIKEFKTSRAVGSCYCSKEHYFYYGLADGYIGIIDIRTNKLLIEKRVQQEWVNTMILLNSNVLISGSDDRNLVFLTSQTLEEKLAMKKIGVVTDICVLNEEAQNSQMAEMDEKERKLYLFEMEDVQINNFSIILRDNSLELKKILLFL